MTSRRKFLKAAGAGAVADPLVEEVATREPGEERGAGLEAVACALERARAAARVGQGLAQGDGQALLAQASIINTFNTQSKRALRSAGRSASYRRTANLSDGVVFQIIAVHPKTPNDDEAF